MWSKRKGNKCYPRLESSWLICSLIGEWAVSLAFAASRFWINLEFVLNFGFFTVIVSSWNAIVWKLTVWCSSPTWSTLISCRARDIPSVTSCQWSFSSFSTSLVTSGVAGTVLYCATHLPSITCSQHVNSGNKSSRAQLLKYFSCECSTAIPHQLSVSPRGLSWDSLGWDSCSPGWRLTTRAGGTRTGRTGSCASSPARSASHSASKMEENRKFYKTILITQILV